MKEKYGSIMSHLTPFWCISAACSHFDECIVWLEVNETCPQYSTEFYATLPIVNTEMSFIPKPLKIINKKYYIIIILVYLSIT